MYNKNKHINDTHRLCTLYVAHKRASHIRSFFSCIANRSKISRKSLSTRKSILQIISQSRSLINKKQLLVSVINLRFAHVFSQKMTPYESSCFRIILPWGLQIYDWHHRIQIKKLYPVTYDFSQRNQRGRSPLGRSVRGRSRRTSSPYTSDKADASVACKLCNQRFCIIKLRRLAPLERIFRSCPNKYKPRLVRACKGYIQGDAVLLDEVEGLRPHFFALMPLWGNAKLCNKQIGDLLANKAYKYKSSFTTQTRLPLVQNTFNKKHVWYARFFGRARSPLGRPYGSGFCYTKRILNRKRTRFRFCFGKMSQKDSNTIILSISGGQDSIFLLFCLSFLQSQIAFKPKIIWCNHFWQKSSFYTTLHLTKSAMAFSSPILGFLPFHMATSPQLYQMVTPTLCLGKHRIKKNQNKISTICRSFFKKQNKQELSIKNFFYTIKTKWRRKKPKAYKKFIKEISETRARNWRHITIERACTFYGSTLCLNGHTLSDRVETILFNLIRGTKNKNFQTLPWKRRHSNFCYNRFYPTFEQVIRKTHIHFI